MNFYYFESMEKWVHKHKFSFILSVFDVKTLNRIYKFLFYIVFLQV